MRDPLTGETREQQNESLRWAARAMEALERADSLEEYEEPEPPEHIKERRRERREARERRRERVESGEYEAVDFDERCIGLGPLCVHCGDRLPEPGEGPRRCPEVGGA